MADAHGPHRVPRVVIVGGGTAGTIVANHLRRHRPPPELDVVVVDRDDRHLYKPGLLVVPFGHRSPSRLVRSRAAQLRPGVRFVAAEVDRLDVASRVVRFVGERLPLDYDVLVVASGASRSGAPIAGMREGVAAGIVHDFSTLAGATTLRPALARFTAGRLVVASGDEGDVCPIAPLEFAFLADAYFRRHGRRPGVALTLVTPLPGAFTLPRASAALGELLARRDIALVSGFTPAAIDVAARELVAADGRRQGFELAAIATRQRGAAFVGRSAGLGDALGFVPVDPHTFQSRADPAIFAVGDAAALPIAKAASLARFAGAVVADNVLAHLDGMPLRVDFNGRTRCIIETGDRRALLVEFDYRREPSAGGSPALIGLPLLTESRVVHLAKRALEPLYWHGVLPARALRTSRAGTARRHPAASPRAPAA